MVAWALTEEYVGDIGRARQLFEIATTTQADNAEIWKASQEGMASCFVVRFKGVYDPVTKV